MTEVKVRIDLTSTVQRKALNDLFDAIAMDSKKIISYEASMDPNASEGVSPIEEPKKEEPKKAKAAKVVAKKEATEKKDEGITISQVRSVLATKVNLDDNRSKIKEKLTELGANNVTTLDEAQYPEFLTFLEAL